MSWEKLKRSALDGLSLRCLGDNQVMISIILEDMNLQIEGEGQSRDLNSRVYNLNNITDLQGSSQ
jgi:hypothetical protein